MAISTVRRIAARIMKVGESRIKIKPDEVSKAQEALTTDDVKSLISSGVVTAERVKGVPRIRAKIKHVKKKKGRRSGAGSKKGSRFAGVTKKELWMKKTQLQRATLTDLRDSGKLNAGVYRKAYRMIKGNAWRSKAAMMAHFEDAKWLAPKGKQPAPEKK